VRDVAPFAFDLPMNFAIAAGGTGGHLFPGLAVGEVLRSRGHEVMLIVSEKEIDAVATQGRTEFRVKQAPGVGLQSKSPPAIIRFGIQLFAAYIRCRRLFHEFRPHAVIGMGGFTSAAPIIRARHQKLPTFLHDSNAIPGKANKHINARYCTAVLLGFEDCAKHFPRSQCIVTGTPIRQSLAQRVDRTKALAGFGLAPDRRTLLVMGGSQGAHGLNVAACKALAAMRDGRIQVIHLAGQQDEGMVRDAYAKAGVPAFVAPFFHRMEEAYSAADFAIARSGAASLTELSHFSLPSILIPYPFAAEDHQTLNARIFERAGAGILLPEREAAPDVLAQHIRSLIDDSTRAVEMSSRASSLAPRDAAERVADVILSHAKP
jgi:UDP-N-acetylglucosamine--N-acetylmuramyl-(pentapeptide) pyrophosphoryl-undecaprenol N-acetylglucosamine transferase